MDEVEASARIADECASINEEIRQLRKQLPALHRAYDKAWDKHDRVPIEREVPADTLRAANDASRRIFGVYDTIAARKAKLAKLQSPAELERRIHVRERIHALRERRGTMAATARDMGVPDVYLSEKGTFKPGLDARYKSDLINAALEIDGKGALHKFTPTDAEKRLRERNWYGFLVRKREILEEKEAKQAKAKAEKVMAKASAGKDVKPDPKPAKRKKK